MVLLHVVEAPRPVDRPGHAPGGGRAAEEVQHLAVDVAHVDHLHPPEGPAVGRLPAALGVEGGAGEGHRRAPLERPLGDHLGLEGRPGKDRWGHEGDN